MASFLSLCLSICWVKAKSYLRTVAKFGCDFDDLLDIAQSYQQALSRPVSTICDKTSREYSDQMPGSMPSAVASRRHASAAAAAEAHGTE